MKIKPAQNPALSEFIGIFIVSPGLYNAAENLELVQIQRRSIFRYKNIYTWSWSRTSRQPHFKCEKKTKQTCQINQNGVANRIIVSRRCRYRVLGPRIRCRAAPIQIVRLTSARTRLCGPTLPRLLAASRTTFRLVRFHPLLVLVQGCISTVCLFASILKIYIYFFFGLNKTNFGLYSLR